MDEYGIELIMDLHACDPKMFNKISLTQYFKKLCDLIKMERMSFSTLDALPAMTCAVRRWLRRWSKCFRRPVWILAF